MAKQARFHEEAVDAAVKRNFLKQTINVRYVLSVLQILI